MKNYTMTLFKIWMEDTSEFIMYWEIKIETGEKFRYIDMKKAKEFGDNHIKTE